MNFLSFKNFLIKLIISLIVVLALVPNDGLVMAQDQADTVEQVISNPGSGDNTSNEPIEVNITTEKTTIKVMVSTGDPNCEEIADWGQIIKNGSTFTVNVTVKDLTTLPNQVCTEIALLNYHDYELGKLTSGNYKFVVKVTGKVKEESYSKEFTIASSQTNSTQTKDNNTEETTGTSKIDISKTDLVSTSLPIYFWPMAVLGAVIVAGMIYWIIQRVRINRKNK